MFVEILDSGKYETTNRHEAHEEREWRLCRHFPEEDDKGRKTVRVRTVAISYWILETTKDWGKHARWIAEAQNG